jgi:hypothetical protein
MARSSDSSAQRDRVGRSGVQDELAAQERRRQPLAGHFFRCAGTSSAKPRRHREPTAHHERTPSAASALLPYSRRGKWSSHRSTTAKAIADDGDRCIVRSARQAIGSVSRRLEISAGVPRESRESSRVICTGACMSTRCRYCNSTAFGSGCSHSPNRVHEHTCDPSRCEFCGSTAYGPGCSFSPSKRHRHGQGSKCRWCGSTALGPGCSFSPTRTHER